jgi:hypothetical protein
VTIEEVSDDVARHSRKVSHEHMSRCTPRSSRVRFGDLLLGRLQDMRALGGPHCASSSCVLNRPLWPPPPRRLLWLRKKCRRIRGVHSLTRGCTRTDNTVASEDTLTQVTIVPSAIAPLHASTRSSVMKRGWSQKSTAVRTDDESDINAGQFGVCSTDLSNCRSACSSGDE